MPKKKQTAKEVHKKLKTMLPVDDIKTPLLLGIIILTIIGLLYYALVQYAPMPGDPNADISPTPINPQSYLPNDKVFDVFRAQNFPEIRSLAIEREYQENNTSKFDGVLTFADASEITLVGLPARTELQSQLPSGEFVITEYGYEVANFLRGVPLFYDLNTQDSQLVIRTIAGSQEFRIVLSIREIKENEISIE